MRLHVTVLSLISGALACGPRGGDQEAAGQPGGELARAAALRSTRDVAIG